MKILPDLSLDAMRAGERLFGDHYDAPLSLERELTQLHRALSDAPPAERELAFLRIQIPAMRQPISADDLFAGRVHYPLVSFSPEPGGLGYACREEAIRQLLDDGVVDPSEHGEIEDLLAYWKTHSTAARTRAAYPPLLARTLPTDAWTRDSAIAYPLYRLGGTVLDYAKLLRLGVPGLRAQIQARRATATAQQARFLDGLEGMLEILDESLHHYAEQATMQATDAEPTRRPELERIASSLRALSERAPETLHEAIQLVWLYALHSGTWNYGRADDYLGPFLEADLAAGRIDEAEALRLVESWWRLMKVYDNQFNNRVYIGGRGRRHEAAADRFALLAIQATRNVRLNQPQLSLRFYESQNPALMELALTAIGEGCTFPMLYNDEVNIPAVARAFAVDEEEALQYHPYGCGEYILAHRSVGSPNGLINLAKCVEAALHGGRDPISGDCTGPATPPIEELRDFESVWNAYASQVEHHTAACAEQEAIEYAVAGADAPFLFLSALYDDCIERAEPLLSGGVRYLGGTIETYGNTNAADALQAIRTVVFEKRDATLAEVAAACAANFEGEHARIQRLLRDAPKYGNDDPVADAMAQRVHEHVCHTVRDQAGRVGLHSYLVVIINNWANVIFGQVTGATPDGRRRGEALANGNNPAPGADRSGITAFLNSLAKLDPTCHAGAVQNMKFSRELFIRERPKLEAVLRGYWRQGGTQAMITVVSPEDLAAAMEEPEKWGHLMVRVGGFSARFIDLPRGAQEEVLHRTCHA